MVFFFLRRPLLFLSDALSHGADTPPFAIARDLSFLLGPGAAPFVGGNAFLPWSILESIPTPLELVIRAFCVAASSVPALHCRRVAFPVISLQVGWNTVLLPKTCLDEKDGASNFWLGKIEACFVRCHEKARNSG